MNKKVVIITIVALSLGTVGVFLYLKNKKKKEQEQKDKEEQERLDALNKKSGTTVVINSSVPAYQLSASFPLKKGVKGKEVQVLQQFLNKALGNNLLVADGLFGLGTESNLKTVLGLTEISQSQYDKYIKNGDINGFKNDLYWSKFSDKFNKAFDETYYLKQSADSNGRANNLIIDRYIVQINDILSNTSITNRYNLFIDLYKKIPNISVMSQVSAKFKEYKNKKLLTEIFNKLNETQRMGLNTLLSGRPLY
jgi:hypothetical protein